MPGCDLSALKFSCKQNLSHQVDPSSDFVYNGFLEDVIISRLY